MGRIICVTGLFKHRDRHGHLSGVEELLVDYGVDEDTLQAVPLQAVHPSQLGAKFDSEINEWVLEGEQE